MYQAFWPTVPKYTEEITTDPLPVNDLFCPSCTTPPYYITAVGIQDMCDYPFRKSLSSKKINEYVNLEIYPNPTNGLLTIHKSESDVLVTIKNIMGQEIFSFQGIGASPFDPADKLCQV